MGVGMGDFDGVDDFDFAILVDWGNLNKNIWIMQNSKFYWEDIFSWFTALIPGGALIESGIFEWVEWLIFMLNG